MIDARGVTLSAGVALFDEVLDVEAEGRANQSQVEALDKADPLLAPAAAEPFQRGDD